MTDTHTPKIVILDGYTLNPGDLSWEALEALGTVAIHNRTPYEQVAERIGDADIVLTNKTRIDAAILEQCPNIRYIGVLATGYDVVDVETAQQRHIIVTNIPTYGTNSVAQMVVAQLLSFCHRVEHHSAAVKEGRWSQAPDWCFWDYPQIELDGKTMGVIGFGRIGHQVGRIASVLGMNVQAFDSNQRDINDVPGFRWVDDVRELFQTSDVISLNCPLTPETAGIINRDNLQLMKPTALLLNCSRGGLVVDDDLADALNAGRIAGAGLDVLSTEPPDADNPLLSAKNILITPHIAWATREARQRLMTMAVENLQAFLDETPQNVVSS
ncbi:MAG: D-2-hydroxyacid dehydrogenase [Chloroflexi bacterium]|nr:MAG: D-2-hydroxyacid dehydrogenase [Chloroflexota bacterium]